MDLDAKRRRHRNERIAAALFVICAAAGAFAVRHWAQGVNEQAAADKVYVPRPQVITPEILLLRDYVRLDTSNPPGNELHAAQWLAAQLTRHGIASEIIEAAPRRANLYARIKGKHRGNALLLTHHMDVVPAKASEWESPPFAAETRLNMLWGRGALDAKGIGITQLLAFIDVAKSGITPEHDLVLLAVADEETGRSEFGMKWLLENRRDIFQDVAWALNEGGITEMMREQPTYFGVEVGTKLLITAHLRGSYEQLQQARIALEPYMGSRMPERILPEVRSFFRALAPRRVRYRELLADIDATVARGQFWQLPSGYRELTQNIVAPSAITRNGEAAVLTVNLYNLPDEDAEARITWLTELVKPFGATVVIVRNDLPAPITSDDTPMFRLFRAEVGKMHPGTPVGPEILNNSTNDSRFLRRHGIACYGVPPFLADVSLTAAIHRPDERIRLDWFQGGCTLMRNIVRAWATGAAAN